MPESVPPTSLRLDEARTRAELLDVHETAVVLDLTDPGDTFTSTTTITFGCRRPGASTFLDFKGSELRGARLNGAALDLSSWSGGRIPLSDLAAENTVEIDGVMAYSSDGEGLHRHIDPADGRTYLYAMSFLDAGPEWFASFDQPDLKSRYHFDVSAPADWTVLGNGPSVSVAPGRWTITPLQPLSTYFVTLVAGPYASVQAEHDGIRLGFHVRASLGTQLEAEAADMIEVTKQCLDYYHRVFGVRYPFGEYHQAFVPDFNAGAMENPGCVTFRDQFIFRSRATAAERGSRAGVIAHEMAHQWFGDLVTMRWWDDLWLNESFAEYMAHRCCTEVTRYPLWAEFGIQRKDWGAMADQSPSSHPVAGNGAVDAAAALQDFDGISYAKGASVLKQLVAYLGDDVFWDGLHRYFAAHAFANASFADLMAAWTQAGAAGLDAWAAAWLRTSGMDVLSTAADELTRTGPESGSPEPGRPHAVVVGYLAADGRDLGEEQIVLQGDRAALVVPDDTALILPDSGDDTWARIRYGQVDLGRAAAIIGRTADSSSRVVLANAVRDAVRNAEVTPAAALTILLDLVGSEQSDVVLSSLLRFGSEQLAGPYAAPTDRAAALAQIDAVVGAQLRSAEPGGDRQLALFRTAVRSSADVELLRRQLRGERLPDGLELDPDLSWAMVDRLIVLGADPATIDDQLAADPSSAAHVHAARARAGVPDPEAKQAAWRLVMEPAPTSAYELYATAEGFFRPDQSDLCRPYVARYFHEIDAVARFRSGWVLGQLATLAYPLTYSTPDVLDLARRTLERDDLAAPVRRALVDSTDRLRRAVAARQLRGS